MVDEIKEVLHNNFGSIKKAHEYFNQRSKTGLLDFDTFRHGIEYLLPNRFIDSDVKDLWAILSSD